jgi:F5/8 type C domain/Alpha-L-fucosidase
MIRLNRSFISLFLLAIVCAVLIGITAIQPNSAILRANSSWFGSAKYGLATPFFPPARGVAANGDWNRMVDGFDVPAFVKDVRSTGAKYVIFPVGQTSGFYNSPNNFFISRTGTKLGEYVPRRDLVKDVARALKKYKISTLVYIAAEGPTAAPVNILQSFPVRDDQASPETRASINNMVREWSKRWGTDVVGWWMDGSWVKGYTNSTDGRANLNALMAAARAGNPASIIAVNPSSGKYTALSDDQNFLAGEDESFHKYPRQRFVQHQGKNIQWHTISFLGDKWGEAGTKRYNSDQIASYVKHVSDLGGIVTIDVALSATSRINPGQLAQLAKIKKVVRDGAPLKTYPSLTKYKPVYLLSNRPSGQELPINGASYFHYGSYAVDGLRNLRQNAQASVEADWNLLVDLMRPQQFQRSTITFPPNNYATEYQILVSSDRASWKVIATGNINKGGTYNHKFPATTARYVKVKALAPNKAGQPGDQMAISEFELFP